MKVVAAVLKAERVAAGPFCCADLRPNGASGGSTYDKW
jgi:hypothetical protein